MATMPKYDLSNCDREPIHELGHIQPFGAMVAFTADWLLAQKSANVHEFAPDGVELRQGMSANDIFCQNAIEALREAHDRLDEEWVERLFALDLFGDGARFDVALHASNGLTLLEFERHSREEYSDHVSMLRPALTELEEHDSTGKLATDAARRLRDILEFDRVMVYRFRPDESGEVIAEARRDDLESFLNLRYPRTDIPQQARALYLRNRFRIISDIDSEPVPIEPGRDLHGKPIDLSMSTLRAVSPIHLEYLRNMGVKASLSISIVVGGKLWGLFACHHYEPKVLAFSLRTVAEVFSQLFSIMLERSQMRQTEALRERGRSLHDRLMARLAGGDSLLDSLPVLDKAIGEVIPHDGASFYIEGEYRNRGSSPNQEEFEAIVPMLNSGTTSTVFVTDSMAEKIPAAAAFADRAVGALVIPVSRRPRDYFVLWRKELKQTVTWAGNPEKPVETGPNGDRLMPRSSFAAWQQSVDGHSEPWTHQELNVADSLRITLLEVILRMTDAQAQERERAQEQQELLIAELNHRVRNILNLIRGLISQSGEDADSIADFTKIVGGRIAALATAHDNITRENWSPASAHALLRNEAEAYLGAKESRLSITGPDAMVTPEAYTVLALVLHEMVTNSAKYGSLCDSAGTLSVAFAKTRVGDLEINWRERGGPPVKPPTRRGFGSTIIERSIPFELKGEAKLSYKLEGVEARFVIPARYVAKFVDIEERDADLPPEAEPARSGGSGGDVPQHVLVVEDSMIIAMDAEDSLRQIGVKVVTMAAGVSEALRSIDEDEPEFALLDFNLGSESSEPVAEALKARGIPFVLATGYGDMQDKMAGLGAMDVLKKPYDGDDLGRVLAKLAKGGAD